MKAHFPAIYRMRDGMAILTSQVYPDIESARKDLGQDLLRLATEYPPLMLEVAEVKAQELKIQTKASVPDKQREFNWSTGRRNG